MIDILIIGAGHNALTTAFYLARAGRRPVVLERRSGVGGAAITGELAPGYRCPTLAHTLGPLRPSIVRDMQLARRGVAFVHPDPRLVALTPDGRALMFSSDEARTVEAIRAWSARDAERYPAFRRSFAAIGRFLAGLLESTPPSLGQTPSPSEIWEWLKTGRRFRALGKQDAFRLLRWGPMAVADLVGESFETDLLRAAIASQGIFGTAMGPWSAGSAAVLLLRAASDPAPGGSSVSAVGGPGAVTHAMADAAREAGAEMRTGVEVTRVIVRNGAAAGVVLADGSELQASAVISGVDPRRTFLGLVDPMDLDPGFLTRIRNYRMPGTVAKLNLALRGLPAFRGVDDPAAQLRGRLHIGPGIDYLERAFDASKYGEISPAPYLDVMLPSLADPSLAPAGHHVMSIAMQYAPRHLRAGAWNDRSREIATLVLNTLEPYAPGVGGLVEHVQVITPAELEESYGLTGGHILHGEPALDQLFTMRPTLGWAQYQAPIAGLFLCGSGTHPGDGLTGGSGQNASHAIQTALKQTSR